MIFVSNVKSYDFSFIVTYLPWRAQPAAVRGGSTMRESAENIRQLLISWRVARPWRNAIIERVEKSEEEKYVATLFMELPKGQNEPWPLTREMPGEAGKMQYRLEWTLNQSQYEQWVKVTTAHEQREQHSSISTDQRDQRWTLPTKKGAEVAARAFAVKQGHNPRKIRGVSRRRKTETESIVIYWRVVYIQEYGSQRVFAYMVETQQGKIHVDPTQIKWERKNRELPLLTVTLEDEMTTQNWDDHRKLKNKM